MLDCRTNSSTLFSDAISIAQRCSFRCSAMQFSGVQDYVWVMRCLKLQPPTPAHPPRGYAPPPRPSGTPPPKRRGTPTESPFAEDPLAEDPFAEDPLAEDPFAEEGGSHSPPPGRRGARRAGWWRVPVRAICDPFGRIRNLPAASRFFKILLGALCLSELF